MNHFFSSLSQARRLLGVVLFLIILAAPAYAQGPAPYWLSAEVLPANAIMAADASGHLFVTGRFEGSITFGGTTLSTPGGPINDSDVFVACFNVPTRTWLWAMRAGGRGWDAPRALAVNNQGQVFVTGYYDQAATFGSTILPASTTQNMFVAALHASTGAWLWARYGSGNRETYGFALTTDTTGHVYVGGTYNSNQGSTFGPFAITTRMGVSSFIGRLAASTGTWEWVTAGGGFIYDLTVDNAGQVYAGGNFSNFSATFGNTQLHSPTNTTDAYVARIDATTGVWQWAVSAGGTDHEVIGRLTTDAQGQLYVAGAFYGTTATFGTHTLTKAGSTSLVDGFAARLDPATRTWQWATAAAGSSGDVLVDVAVDHTGSLYVLSRSISPSLTIAPLTFNTSAGGLVVVRLHPATGAALWGLQAAAEGSSLVFDQAGFGYVTGECYGMVPFGTTTLGTDPNSQTSFIARFQPGTALAGMAPANSTGHFYFAPNPATSSTTLHWPAGHPATPLTLTDARGRAVRRYPAPGRSAGNITLDLRGLPAGLYLVHGASFSQKLVVE